MIVKDLIERLQELPQDMDVLTAKDEEGNGFNDVYSVGVYYWDGYENVRHPDDAEGDEEQVVVIW